HDDAKPQRREEAHGLHWRTIQGMDLRTQSLLLAAIMALALGLSMLLRAGRPRVLTLYSVFALIVGGFYLAQFSHTLLETATRLPWLGRTALGASLILGALVPSAALAFFLEFLGVSPNTLRRGRRIALLSGIFGLAVGMTPLAHEQWARIAVSV